MKSKKAITGNTGTENPDERLRELMKGNEVGPFSVPQGYFDVLPDIIEKKVTGTVSLQEGNIRKFSSLWAWAGIAAGLLLLAGIFILIHQERRSDSYPQISQSEQQSYHKSGVSANISKDSVRKDDVVKKVGNPEPENAGRFSEQIIQQQNSTDVLPPEQELTEDDIINYLMEEDFDLSDLTN